ncbi:YncE family protein [Flavobacterium sp. 3-218]
MKKIVLALITVLTIVGCSNNDSNEQTKEANYSVPDTLNFTIFNNKLVLNIENQGEVLLNYSIVNSKSYVSLSKKEGNITSLNHDEITVTVDKQNLPNGKSYSKLYLNINNKKDSIVVSVTNFVEQKVILNSDVVDAEFSKVTNQLVYVSSSPAAVNILSTNTGLIESIPLSYLPTCISISPDGKTALAGHDGYISYINLTGKTITKTYPVSCYANDIVLAGNKWAYVFPKNGQSTFIRSINLNLANDNEYQHLGEKIYEGNKARLHPSGKYIYGAENGLSPMDIEKYDIQNGNAEYSYDSPYHGDYIMNGNLWFSEDGNRIFTRGKTVFKTSELRSQDMLYNGVINTDTNPYTPIQWLDHSVAKNNLYLLLVADDSWTQKKLPYIYIYNDSNLAFKNKIPLEQFLVSKNESEKVFYDAEPFFVFSNSIGNNLFVIVKATGSGLAKEWAIEKISVE